MIKVQILIDVPGVGSGALAVTRSAPLGSDPTEVATQLLADAAGYAAEWLDDGCPELGEKFGFRLDEGNAL